MRSNEQILASLSSSYNMNISSTSAENQKLERTSYASSVTHFMAKWEVKLCVELIDYLVTLPFDTTWIINITEIPSKGSLPQTKNNQHISASIIDFNLPRKCGNKQVLVNSSLLPQRKKIQMTHPLMKIFIYQKLMH